MIRIVEGSILNAVEDIICQQVNCQGVMGAGLAKQIRDKYPAVYTSYKKFCDGYNYNDRMTLLGQIQTTMVSDGKIIANLFGQYNYGRDKQHTEYNALTGCLEQILELAKLFNDSIAIPYNLGCGLAGGDWSIVYAIIEEVFDDYDVTIYKL